MSLNDSATLIKTLTIDVRGRRSERRLGALALSGLALATSVLTLPALQAALFFMVASAAVTAGLWWHGWLAGARRLTHVTWLSDGSWRLTDAQTNHAATLSRHCRVGSRWVWLGWHIGTDHGADGPQGIWGAKHRWMLLVQGDISTAELRRLGVRLRLESVCLQPAHMLFTGA